MAQNSVIGILRVLLQANTAQFDSEMKKASDSVKRTAKDFKQIGQSLTDVGSTLTKAFTIPIAGIAAASAKLAIDFESSFAGVRKTLNATEPEFQAIAQAFRELSKQIPINVNDLNKLGEAAGALGIPKAEVVDFARVMALLGETTNLSADQAAESVAKIQNIFGAAGKDTERFASTLVALGNDGASTETQIVEMATRIAGAGHALNMTQGEVLAFASALSSVGIEAEMGGSAISRVFIDIASSVSKGGEAVEGFARVAGMNIDQFSKMFKEDAAGAVNAFVLGLGHVKTSGGDLLGTLDELGFSEIRVRDTLLRAAGAGDLLTNALTLQKTAWQENTALTDEARKRFETTAARAELLWNKLKDVGITLGNALKPAIDAAITALDRLLPILDGAAKVFAVLPPEMQAAAIGTAAVVAALGPLLVIVGQMALGVSALTAAFATNGVAMRAIGPASAIATTGIGAVRAAALALVSPLGIAAAAAAAAAAALTHFIEKRAEARLTAETDAAKQDTINAAIARGAVTLKDITDKERAYAEAVKFNDEWNQKRLGTLKATADQMQRTTGATKSLTDKLDEQNAKVAAADKEIAQLSKTAQGKLTEAIKSGAFSIKDLSEATGLSELALKRFEDRMSAAGRATKDTSRDLEASIRRTQEATRAYESYVKVLDQAISTEARKSAGEATARRINPLTETIDDAINRIGAFKVFKDGIPVVNGLSDAFKDLGEKVYFVVPKVVTLGETITNNLKKAIEGLPALFQQAFTGGGGVLGALKAFGTQLADALTRPLSEKLGATLAGLFASGMNGIGGASSGGQLPGGGAAPGVVTGLAGTGLGATGAFTGVGGAIALSAATMGISAAAIGVALLARKLFSQAGRDAVEAFAEEAGGFNTLRDKLTVLGAEGERLWINLTQKVAHGSKQEAQAAIDAIQEALSKHEADVLKLTEAHDQAVAAITDKYASSLNAIDQERKTLMERIGAEMPEEVMGIQETLDRARVDQLDKDKAAIEEKQRLEMEALEESLKNAESGAREWIEKVQDIFTSLGLEIPVKYRLSGGFPTPPAPGTSSDPFEVLDPPLEFSRGSQGWRDFGTGTAAVLHGVEAVVRPGDMALGVREYPVILQVDGREFARAMVPVFPGEANRLGVRVRT